MATQNLDELNQNKTNAGNTEITTPNIGTGTSLGTAGAVGAQTTTPVNPNIAAPVSTPTTVTTVLPPEGTKGTAGPTSTPAPTVTPTTVEPKIDDKGNIVGTNLGYLGGIAAPTPTIPTIQPPVTTGVGKDEWGQIQSKYKQYISQGMTPEQARAAIKADLQNNILPGGMSAWDTYIAQYNASLTAGGTGLAGTEPTTTTGGPAPTSNKGLYDKAPPEKKLEADKILAMIDPEGKLGPEKQDILDALVAGDEASFTAVLNAYKIEANYQAQLLKAYRLARDAKVQQDWASQDVARRTAQAIQQYNTAIDEQAARVDAMGNNLSIIGGTTGRLQSRNMVNSIMQVMNEQRRILNNLHQSKAWALEEIAANAKYNQDILSNKFNDAWSELDKNVRDKIKSLSDTGIAKTAEGLEMAQAALDKSISEKVQLSSQYVQSLQSALGIVKMQIEQRTPDMEMSNSIQGGYLRNKQGEVIVGSNGAPLTYNPTKKIQTTVSDGKGGLIAVYTDGTHEAIMEGQRATDEEVKNYAKIARQYGIAAISGLPEGIKQQVLAEMGKTQVRTAQEVFEENFFDLKNGTFFDKNKNKIVSLSEAMKSFDEMQKSPYVSPGQLNINGITNFIKNKRGDKMQCGQAANDYWEFATGKRLGIGDSFDSKIKAISAYGISKTPQVGSVFVMDTGTWTGHTGIVTAVNADGSIEVLEANRENLTEGSALKPGKYSAATAAKMAYSDPPAGAMQTQTNAVDFIKKHEGFRGEAYDDGTGKITIGYGFTTHEDGTPVKLGETMTREEADKRLATEIANRQKYMDYITVNLNENQKAALSSFEYNEGSYIWEKGAKNILDMINAGDLQGAAAEMKKYNTAGGKVLGGLVNRRNEEAQLLQSTAMATTEGKKQYTQEQIDLAMRTDLKNVSASEKYDLAVHDLDTTDVASIQRGEEEKSFTVSPGKKYDLAKISEYEKYNSDKASIPAQYKTEEQKRRFIEQAHEYQLDKDAHPEEFLSDDAKRAIKSKSLSVISDKKKRDAVANELDAVGLFDKGQGNEKFYGMDAKTRKGMPDYFKMRTEFAEVKKIIDKYLSTKQGRDTLAGMVGFLDAKEWRLALKMKGEGAPSNIPFLDDFAVLDRFFGENLATYLNTISGTAVSEPEAERLKRNVPNMDSSYTTFLNAYRKLAKDMDIDESWFINEYGFDDLATAENMIIGQGENRLAAPTGQNVGNYLDTLFPGPTSGTGGTSSGTGSTSSGTGSTGTGSKR